MASVKREGARKPLADEDISATGVHDKGTEGLAFSLTIGDIVVKLSHVERDMAIGRWAEQEKEFLR